MLAQPVDDSGELVVNRNPRDGDSRSETMKNLRTTPKALLLTLTASLVLSGCDQGDELDRNADADELADAEDPSNEILPEVELELVADAPTSLSGPTYASSYDGEINLSALGDGDVVMLRSYPQGFVGCNASGEVQTSHSPTVIDGYVWMVHRTDIDGDGTDELQLELIDGSGETGTYLKMNGSDELSCGAITGIGDAAGWNFEQSVSTGGTYYRTVLRMLSNHKHGQCLSFSDSGGSGASCVSYKDRLFSFEILAHAS